jgi:hypothetical protein
LTSINTATTSSSQAVEKGGLDLLYTRIDNARCLFCRTGYLRFVTVETKENTVLCMACAEPHILTEGGLRKPSTPEGIAISFDPEIKALRQSIRLVKQRRLYPDDRK